MSAPIVLSDKVGVGREICMLGLESVDTRAGVFDVRGTTRRAGDNGVVLTTVSIRLEFWVGVTPGFRFVRILLFIYGYI